METPSYNYDLILLILGLAFFGLTFLTRLLSKTLISIAMVYIAVGMLLAFIFPNLPGVDPVENGLLIERLSELAVIISLMEVGLKLDRPFGWRSWLSTWRLLGITMPLCIAALAVGGVWLIGLPVAAAVLLGSVLAPTDPVLAGEVQGGPPGTSDKNEIRFALTSEAGLNDGLAFPFVNLAIVLAVTGFAGEGLVQWFTVDFIWKIFAGLAVGAAIGYLIAILVSRYNNTKTITDGFVAIALTLFTYGATELIHGYGFIAVFVAAVVFRRYERKHEYHKTLHNFTEQIAQLLMSVILILLGIAIGQGLFNALTLSDVILALIFLLLVRPAAGMLGLIGMQISLSEKAKISWLGIRGIATFYYLAYGLNNANFEEAHAREIWAVAAFIVVVSIVLHGTSSHYIMKPHKD
jgi:sodium/hydrogen antiporter